MFNVGGGEMLVILLLALLVLGPERLPKAMGQVGRYVAELRKLSSGFQDEIRRAMDPEDGPFPPGEERLPGPVTTRGEEVRAIAPASTGGDDADEPVDEGADVPEAEGDDQADDDDDDPLVAEARRDEASGVTPLHPRRGGDARATG
jgi:sec-independent protein translocase protein TatB